MQRLGVVRPSPTRQVLRKSAEYSFTSACRRGGLLVIRRRCQRGIVRGGPLSAIGLQA